jgi:hypothetical protein
LNEEPVSTALNISKLDFQPPSEIIKVDPKIATITSSSGYNSKPRRSPKEFYDDMINFKQ